MSFRNPIASAAVFAVSLLLFVFVLSSASAQTPEIFVKVGDTTALPGEQGVLLPVSVSNYNDSVAGFEFWLQMSRPDVAEFSVASVEIIDTTWWLCVEWSGPECVDSIALAGHHDTLHFQCLDYDSLSGCTDSMLVTVFDQWDFYHIHDADFYHVDTVPASAGGFSIENTLIEDWEYIEARSDHLHNFRIVAIADMLGGGTVPGFPPVLGGLLVYLSVDIYDIPDTLQDRTVDFLFVEPPGFATPQGVTIGVGQDTIIVHDTTCWHCIGWTGDSCDAWVQVPLGSPDCDSVYVSVYEDIRPNFDGILTENGSITVIAPALRGDMDGDGQPITIADLVYLIQYMFVGGPPPDPLWTADCDSDGEITINDVVCWVNYMFGPSD